MPFAADILVETWDGEPLVIAEVKNHVDLDATMAVSIRHNLVDDYGLPEAAGPAFLLVSQERGFLWTGAESDRLALPPYEFSMVEVVRRYQPSLPAGEWLWGFQLQLLVAQWLRDLIGGRSCQDAEADRAMSESGLLDSLRGARLVQEARV